MFRARFEQAAAERLGHGLHREPSGSGDGQRNSGFFARAAVSASLRISTSRVLRPKEALELTDPLLELGVPSRRR